jgi:hypothetical protein
MCICLNCNYINVCKQYFFIEKNHKESNINNHPKFVPTQSITTVNFFKTLGTIELEWDITECLSFKEKPGKWLIYL